ncbi:polysaccharide biosynthesis C-terminal domain-containing protein [Plebeiibacterium marinum]|uniref:Polysaccharide biosynthesis C-terminal domain-containing protein n=1 Tax=Plebeiibacterium marinum TaxID=2992111 RepID=A0AAE3MFY6_9BACT|nr:polysaccharide biosynthesis C-terminal domain-containing protein [Plebeiobacterium marinum]MCW3806996.1 polysaccharide biosynthesis C-terminal domain-containing protein [Plebeiobacterium marinum]
MSKLKSLAGETIIYGGGTILVRLLNWLMMPYYIRTMDQLQYGYLTEVYSYIAIFLVILTYGFETTFFRFSKEDNYKRVFTTGLYSIVGTSILFLFILFIAIKNLNFSNTYGAYENLLLIAGLIVAIDAISALIFAKMRYKGQSIRFSLIKLLNVFILIFFNVFFLFICPLLKDLDFLLDSNYSRFINWFYNSDYEAYYVLISNLFASLGVLVLLLKDFVKDIGIFDLVLLKKMYKYSYPILIVGITGMVNQSIDKILLPRLIGGEEGYNMVALYGANFKIGVLMAMFTQSFRLAFEPFFFKHNQESKDNTIYGLILTYFILFGLLIFLGVTFFIDVINIILVPAYKDANGVIPLVLLAQLLSGIYFTLSIWYKVTDKTIYGAYMGIVGTLVTLISNILLIPVLGYYGCALSGVLCFLSMVLFSVYWGHKKYPISYNWSKILGYFILASILYGLGVFLWPKFVLYVYLEDTVLSNISILMGRICLLVVFLAVVYKVDIKRKIVF